MDQAQTANSDDLRLGGSRNDGAARTSKPSLYLCSRQRDALGGGERISNPQSGGVGQLWQPGGPAARKPVIHSSKTNKGCAKYQSDKELLETWRLAASPRTRTRPAGEWSATSGSHATGIAKDLRRERLLVSQSVARNQAGKYKNGAICLSIKSICCTERDYLFSVSASSTVNETKNAKNGNFNGVHALDERKRERELGENVEIMIDWYVSETIDLLIDDPYTSIPQISEKLSEAGPCPARKDILYPFGGPLIAKQMRRVTEEIRRATVMDRLDPLPFDVETVTLEGVRYRM